MKILDAILRRCYAAAAPTREALKWPHTTAIDKSDPHWEFNNNLNSNGVTYMKKELTPGDWQWVVNEEAKCAKEKFYQDRYELAIALSTRVLDSAEMIRALKIGSDLYIRDMTPYSQRDMDAKFEHALRIQDELRKMERCENGAKHMADPASAAR